MTKKIVCILTAVLLTIGFAKSSDGALVFSAMPMQFAIGATSVTTQIRVSGLTGDTLQYFAIRAEVVTSTGGKTLSFGASTRDGTITGRTAAPYVLAGRGTLATGATGLNSSFAFNASANTVSFRDGVSVPFASSGGIEIPTAGVSPGSSPGLLVAELQLNASSELADTDSFQINLFAVSGLTITANAFATTVGPGVDLSFSGAANGRAGPGSGTNLGPTLTFSPGSITAVPEPSTFAMLGLVFGLFGGTKLRKRLTRSAT